VATPIGHARAFELLPWFVNGSLAADERDAVELHVRSCITCRREFKEQQRLRAAIRSQPAVHVSTQAGFDRLNRQLATSAHERPRPTNPRPLGAFMRFAVVGVAGGALLAMLLWLAPAPERGAPNFATLATTPAARAKQLDLIFAQSITAAEMQALLDEIDGSITAGPSRLGRYTVRVANGETSAAELGDLIERLASDPRVRFVGPALASEPTQ
jgi:anti-sigma factor RsiW